MAKILVIDDDAVVRETIVLLLQDDGYEVLAADDGMRGMALFRSEQPDLVITDLIMPEKEGIETIRDIRGRSPDTKIIAISGGARLRNFDYLRIAEKFGANEVLAKPFDTGDLLDSVARCLMPAASGTAA